MKKFTIILSLLFAVAFVLTGCTPKDTGAGKNENKKETKTEEKKEEAKKDKESGVADVCNFFPKELVETAIGRKIAKVETNDLADKACYYYTQWIENYENSYSGGKKPGGPKIVVVYDTKDFAKDKISNEKSGSKYSNDPSIPMSNWVVRNNINKIWLVALDLGDEKYIRMKSFDDAVTGEELVKIGIEFAKKIKGDPSISSGNTEPTQTKENASAGGAKQATTNFFENLSALKIQDALALMDADQNTKQAWGVNFNTITSLKIKNISEIYKEEWTDTHEAYKVELDVKVKPEGEKIGWQNGTNFRWITVEKNSSGQWMIHELANNP